MDCSLSGFSVHGILQARTLEWVVISFSNAWKWKVKVKLLSRVWLLATPWTAAYQAPPSMGFSGQQYWSGVPLPSPSWDTREAQKWLSWDGHATSLQSCLTLCNPVDYSPPGSSLSMEFSRQEYWSGWPFPSPGDLPNPGIKLRSLASQTDSLPSELPVGSRVRQNLVPNPSLTIL